MEVKGQWEDSVQLYEQKEMQQVELIDRILSEENIKVAIHAVKCKLRAEKATCTDF